MPAVEMKLQGGDELARKLSEMAAKLSTAGELRVGFLEGATYPDGTPVALVAAAQNFGAPTVGLPPRPFFDRMVRDNEAGWGALIAQGLARSGGDARAALEFAGRIMVEQLQASILAGGFTPLKPETIRRKGFDTQLIDTSHMLNSAASEVL